MSNLTNYYEFEIFFVIISIDNALIFLTPLEISRPITVESLDLA